MDISKESIDSLNKKLENLSKTKYKYVTVLSDAIHEDTVIKLKYVID